MGWKKACEVKEGTWLRLAELWARREDPDMLSLRPTILPLWPPFLKEFLFDQAPRWEDRPVFAVPGLESVTRLLLWGPVGSFWVVSFPSPSSDAISVIRDEMMLGGPAGNLGCGKL